MQMHRVSRGIFWILTMALLGCHTEQGSSYPSYGLSKAEKEQLREGDIILRYGKGIASDLIVELLGEKREISHCGILDRRPDGGFRVIHSVSSSISEVDGMQAQGLEEFVSESVDSTVMVVRYVGKGGKRPGKRIAQRAGHYLKERIPFDPSFELSDSSQFYCTELIERSVQDATGRSVMKGHLDRPNGKLHFDLFWKSDDFRTIIDHHR